eukprot:353835-Chlamydomonas_euryale.AAC.2
MTAVRIRTKAVRIKGTALGSPEPTGRAASTAPPHPPFLPSCPLSFLPCPPHTSNAWASSPHCAQARVMLYGVDVTSSRFFSDATVLRSVEMAAEAHKYGASPIHPADACGIGRVDAAFVITCDLLLLPSEMTLNPAFKKAIWVGSTTFGGSVVAAKLPRAAAQLASSHASALTRATAGARSARRASRTLHTASRRRLLWSTTCRPVWSMKGAA